MMASDARPPGASAPQIGHTTPRVDEARRSVTRTRVTPAPGKEAPATPAKVTLLDRIRGEQHGELTAARQPYPGLNLLRLVLTTLLSVLCLLTIGGAILVLLLWQQDRASGVLSSQLDRTWDLFDTLREVERWVAFAAIPVATAWLALGAVNIYRATGKRVYSVVAGSSLPIGVLGVWLVGSEVVSESSDWVGEAAGFVLQAIFLAIPLLAFERMANLAEARHRPMRVSYLIGVAYLGVHQFLGALATIDQTSSSDEWGKLGAYLVIAGLVQVLGTLAVNEATRAIEEGTESRFQLRQRFGESLLAQAAQG